MCDSGHDPEHVAHPGNNRSLTNVQDLIHLAEQSVTLLVLLCNSIISVFFLYII